MRRGNCQRPETSRGHTQGAQEGSEVQLVCVTTVSPICHHLGPGPVPISPPTHTDGLAHQTHKYAQFPVSSREKTTSPYSNTQPRTPSGLDVGQQAGGAWPLTSHKQRQPAYWEEMCESVQGGFSPFTTSAEPRV